MSSKLEPFASLQWYDSSISFLFRFVAKTSEPLLAAGVIVSAADFLLKGELMAGNPLLAGIWAWTQAVAIEASTGPVLVFALQAFQARDAIKGWLYTVLAVLLFIVGSAMLFLQMIANVTGVTETNMSLFVLYGLFILRVIVSSGMVALSCTKHIRFSGMLAERTAKGQTPAEVQMAENVRTVNIETINNITVLLEAIPAMQRQLEALEQAVTQPHLPAVLPVLSLPSVHTEREGAREPNGSGRENGGKKQRVQEYLAEHPDASVGDIVHACGVARSYASTVRSELMNERTGMGQQGA